MTRGKKSRVTIAGHNMTWAELSVLHQLQESMLYADTSGGISLRAIFPGENRAATRKRYCARGLASRGVLQAACQMELENDILKGKPQ